MFSDSHSGVIAEVLIISNQSAPYFVYFHVNSFSRATLASKFRLKDKIWPKAKTGPIYTLCWAWPIK